MIILASCIWNFCLSFNLKFFLHCVTYFSRISHVSDRIKAYMSKCCFILVSLVDVYVWGGIYVIWVLYLTPCIYLENPRYKHTITCVNKKWDKRVKICKQGNLVRSKCLKRSKIGLDRSKSLLAYKNISQKPFSLIQNWVGTI